MPRLFEVERVPISRIRLQERLKMLGDGDKNTVEQVQRFLLWDRQQPERTDDEVQMEYDRLMNSVSNKLVRDIINHRIDVRTITCALRRRRLGLDPPSGVGQYVEHIRKHWRAPDFRLAREHPWIPRVREGLAAKQTLNVERELLRATWNHWVKLADQFYFSFETVLLYLARWEIVDRWTRLDESAGRQKFDQFLAQTLAFDGDAT
ncbi:MAG: hypothetical protein CL608_27885 [Anaerolineaceae bacterium]|nr:hypothetical protein [Anaerolineaceae bacterium]